MTHGIEYTCESNGIGILLIDRPAVRNALDWDAMDAFRASVDQAGSDPQLKVLIVTGAGATFISGGDLKVLQHHATRSDGERLAATMGDALARLERLECVTIAAVNGPARGGGAEVAIACDLRIFAENADIGFVHARLGIMPAWGGGQRLLQAVGYSTALDLLVSGRVIDAREAYEFGIADRVVPDALAAARQFAEEIAQRPVETVWAIKRSMLAGISMPYEQALAQERKEFPALWDSDTLRTAIRKFIDRSSKSM